MFASIVNGMLSILMGLSTICCQMKTPKNKKEWNGKQIQIIIGYLRSIHCHVSKASIDLEEKKRGRIKCCIFQVNHYYEYTNFGGS